METINHEYYVSLEVAKLLKKAGFDWWANQYYGSTPYINGEKVEVHMDKHIPEDAEWCINDKLSFCGYRNHADELAYAAPSLDVAQRWLREMKNTHIIVTYNPTLRADYVYDVFVPCNKFWLGSPISYDTYEEALEAAIEKALKIILEK